jgi:hypothetical protein
MNYKVVSWCFVHSTKLTHQCVDLVCPSDSLPSRHKCSSFYNIVTSSSDYKRGWTVIVFIENS